MDNEPRFKVLMEDTGDELMLGVSVLHDIRKIDGDRGYYWEVYFAGHRGFVISTLEFENEVRNIL